jgi:hypothetical protein
LRVEVFGRFRVWGRKMATALWVQGRLRLATGEKPETRNYLNPLALYIYIERGFRV